MSDKPTGSFESDIIGLRAPEEALRASVAPVTGPELNTLRATLIPFACWKVENIRFDLDSSFVKPEIRGELVALKRLIDQHALRASATENVLRLESRDPAVIAEPEFPPLLSVFGHADPVGDDGYNKILSGRRAQAIYGMLTRKVELWEELYSLPPGGDFWGFRSIQTMLSSLGQPLKINGAADKASTEALKAFQKSQGLPGSGAADKATRKALFLAYMDFLCQIPMFELKQEGLDRLAEDEVPLSVSAKLGGVRDRLFEKEGELMAALGQILTAEELDRHKVAIANRARLLATFKVSAKNFLGGGKDKDGKGDYQGCSEFNLSVVLSQKDQAGMKPEQRIEANGPNRRVVVLLYRPKSQVDPNKWPCPRAKEGIIGCVKRFWSDGEKRRSLRLPDKARKYKESKDTFACRFYDRMANTSPCEKSVSFWILRILEDSSKPVDQRRAISNQPFVVTNADGSVEILRASTDGNGVLRIPVRNDPIQMRLRIAGVEFKLLGGALLSSTLGPEAMFQRLTNLGFNPLDQSSDPRARSTALISFQKVHQLPTTGALDAVTAQKLLDSFGA